MQHDTYTDDNIVVVYGTQDYDNLSKLTSYRHCIIIQVLKVIINMHTKVYSNCQCIDHSSYPKSLQVPNTRGASSVHRYTAKHTQLVAILTQVEAQVFWNASVLEFSGL